jgi:putative NADPH-quinone reductase
MARGAELDPVIAAHCAELARAEGLVFVHPNWWGMPPAALTGWLDRVLRPGVAYEFLEVDAGQGVPRGLLKARAAEVFNTGDTAAERERLVFGDPLERIWRDCVCGLCGVTNFTRRLFGEIGRASCRERVS